MLRSARVCVCTHTHTHTLVLNPFNNQGGTSWPALDSVHSQIRVSGRHSILAPLTAFWAFLTLHSEGSADYKWQKTQHKLVKAKGIGKTLYFLLWSTSAHNNLLSVCSVLLTSVFFFPLYLPGLQMSQALACGGSVQIAGVDIELRRKYHTTSKVRLNEFFLCL